MVSVNLLHLTRYFLCGMGRKRHKGRVSGTTKAKKNPTAMEGGTAQINKQPRRKKSIWRRQIKSRFSHRRPVSSTSKAKKGQGRNQDSKFHKRLPYSPETTDFCGKTECVALFPTESRVNYIPPKTANKQELSSTACVKVEVRSVDRHAGGTENPQPPLIETFRISSTKANTRSKLSTIEKRRYQTVFEYQFIYPGKTVFHCTKESVKQQLRSIYLGPRGQKLLRPTLQYTQMPHHQLDKNKTPRENSKMDTSCPVDSELLRSLQPDTTTSGLNSLACKINKLALVNETETACLSTLSGFQPGHNLQHQSPPAAVFQGPSSPNERKTDKEEQRRELDFNREVSVRGAAGEMLKESSASSTKPRPLSAKDCFGKTPSMKSIENNSEDNSKKEDMAGSRPDVSPSSKGGVTYTQSATTMPMSHQFSSKENVGVEMPPNACLNIAQRLAGVRQREPLPTDFGQPAAREENLCKILGPCSPRDKRDVYALATAGSKSNDPLTVDTWLASETGIRPLD